MRDGLETLVVSNGTPCDHLYEILDSFAIYPELVKKTLARVEELVTADIDDGVLPEECFLIRQLSRFWIVNIHWARKTGREVCLIFRC